MQWHHSDITLVPKLNKLVDGDNLRLVALVSSLGKLLVGKVHHCLTAYMGGNDMYSIPYWVSMPTCSLGTCSYN